jgi:3-hydroxyacyl-CoA dehydrogenase/enoyl-CoA hydratase/3-hydroxybutyryl-CoA epimerase
MKACSCRSTSASGREQRYFTKILRTKEAAAMIRSLFVSMQELNKGARRPAERAADTKLKKVGIIGAGFMGAGIAYVTANAGIDVVLVDRDIRQRRQGQGHSTSWSPIRSPRVRAKTAERDALLGRIKASADYADLKGCDLIVEAVFEDPKVKAEDHCQGEAVLKPQDHLRLQHLDAADQFAGRAQRGPKNFIGIHFFSPVEKMMLVEIIMGKKTGKKALAMALDFVRAIKKTPIVVNDVRGFYANRCVLRYIREGTSRC